MAACHVTMVVHVWCHSCATKSVIHFLICQLTLKPAVLLILKYCYGPTEVQ